MTDGHWKRLATSWVLLAAVLLGAGVLIALIGSTVFPQAMLFAWAAIVLLVFLLIQLLVFRAFGLRSRADEQLAPPRARSATATEAAAASQDPGLADLTADAAPGEAHSGAATAIDSCDAQAAEPEAADRDWRAWRG